MPESQKMVDLVYEASKDPSFVASYKMPFDSHTQGWDEMNQTRDLGNSLLGCSKCS